MRSIAVILFLAFFSCKKSKPVIEEPTGGGGNTVIKEQVDPATDPSIGFFMKDWAARNFLKPEYTEIAQPVTYTTTVTIDRSDVITKVSPYLLGHNANIWMSQMIDQPDLLGHISALNAGFIRFPGGSISNLFFWNAENGKPPATAPAKIVRGGGAEEDAGYWYGKNNDYWTLSVDNYYKVREITSNKGLITVNYGYARYGTGKDPVADAAHLAAEWVRYDKGRTAFWEVGNEHFGDWEAGYRINTATNQDGQPLFQTGELYGRHFKVFADSMRKAAKEVNVEIRIGAVLFETDAPSWATVTNKTWNEGVLSTIGESADYYVLHSYFTPYHTNATAAEILKTALEEPGKMMQFHKKELQKYGKTVKPVVLNEWNIFSTGSKQMASYVNGLHAVLVLGEMMQQKWGMAARWDLANGWEEGNDHGLFNVGDEPGGIPRWNPRAPFYYMYYLQRVMGDRLVKSVVNNNSIKSYAMTYSSGETSVVLVNTGTAAVNVKVKIENFKQGNRFYWYILTGGNDNGDFSGKVYVNGIAPTNATGGPVTYKNVKALSAALTNEIIVNVPSRSAVFAVIDKQ